MRYCILRLGLLIALAGTSLSVLSQRNNLFSLSTYRGSVSTGLYDAGAIFKIDSSRTKITEEFSFHFPNFGWRGDKSIIEGSNGNLYGLSSTGGRGDGNIFKYDTSLSTYTNLFNLGDIDSVDVSSTRGSLVEASNGKFYGIATNGGAYNFGTIFEYNDTNGTFKNRFSFNDTLGKNPQGTLVEHSNGKLYGLSQFGGKSNNGLIFEFDIATGVVTKKKDLFDYNINVNSDCAFSLSSAGKLFGVGHTWKKITPQNIASAAAIFEYDVTIDSILIHVNYLDSSSKGINVMRGEMVEDSSGMLYGIDGFMGPRIFKFNPTTFKVDTIYRFLEIITEVT